MSCHLMALALAQTGQADTALPRFQKAIASTPSNHEIHTNLGSTLITLERCSGALDSFDKAIRLKPDSVDAFYNRSIALQCLQRFDEALASYDQVTKFAADHVSAHYNKALLLLGQFKEGWDLFEWRWQSRNFISPRRTPTAH